MVKFLAAHLAPEGGCVVILRQTVHGGLIEVHRLVQPKGVCENTGHGAVIAVVGVPNAGSLRPQSVDVLAAQQGEDLLTAFSIRYFCQHGKSHIHIQGRIDLVLSVGAAEKFPDGAAEKRLQTIRIAFRLVALRVPVFLPCVIDHIKAVAVEFAGLFVEIFHLIGVRRHLRIACQCQRIGRGGAVGFLLIHIFISRAAHQGNQAGRRKA